MSAGPDGLRETALAVVAVAREQQATLLAASLAYFSFVSLVPLLLLVLVGLATLGSADLALRAARLATEAATPGLETPLEGLLADRVGRGRATAVGLTVLLWSAFRLFRALDGVFAAVYGERDRRTVRRSLRDAALVFATLFVALVLLGVVGVFLPLRLPGDETLLGPLVLFVALVVVFLPTFVVFPAADVGAREALPGVVFAAGAWSLSALAFQAYAAAEMRVYDTAGAFVLVLTWLYVGGLALVLGAITNAVLADRIAPDEEWLPAEYM